MRIATLRITDDKDIVRLRQVGQSVAKALGFETFAQTRIVTALMELARNTLQHGGGGQMILSLAGRNGLVTLMVQAVDQGPGIKDLKTLLHGEGAIASAGPGLGLGLRGVHRIADVFDAETGPAGTRIEVGFLTALAAAKLSEAARRVTDDVVSLERADPAAMLAQQNRELMQALAERDLMMAEIHHRTRNNLALVNGLIRLSRASAQSSETREALADLENRIHAIMKVHEQLQRRDAGDTLEVLPLLRDVSDHATAAFSMPGRTVRVSVDGDAAVLSSSAAIDVALVVGELITNALKHAFSGRESGRITIDVSARDTGLKLIVADDGHGLPDGMEKPERSASLGWRMIRSTTQKYGGTIDVRSESGLVVELVLNSINPVEEGASDGSEGGVGAGSGAGAGAGAGAAR